MQGFLWSVRRWQEIVGTFLLRFVDFLCDIWFSFILLIGYQKTPTISWHYVEAGMLL
jgi:hypothetical protein